MKDKIKEWTLDMIIVALGLSPISCGDSGGGENTKKEYVTEVESDNIIANKFQTYEYNNYTVNWYRTNWQMDLYDASLDQMVVREVDAIFTPSGETNDSILIHKVDEGDIDYLINLLNDNGYYNLLIIRDDKTTQELSDILDYAESLSFAPGEYE
ncbi:hypothetical protein GF361_03550 [Candidatus Woesearchaeota archaeon]|nr:hypothetical protein [Candidatus Woesearchaeota archaeon]